jgi:hypothetical protein
MKEFFLNAIGCFSLKTDEIAISHRIRWNPSNNEFCGLCFNLKDSIDSFKFEHWGDLLSIKQSLEDHRIHIATEAIQLVLSSRIGSKKIFEPSSNCMHYTKLSMGPASKSTKSYPSTN